MTEIVVESSPAGLRAALLDGSLEAIEIDPAGRPTSVGAVMPMRMVRSLAAGSIVRLPDGREALLKRGGRPAPADGETVTAQILRDPHGDKLALATRSVSLAGRALIHLPLEPGVRFSQRLTLAPEDKQALEAKLTGSAGGWIVRSSITGATASDLESEISALAAEGDRVRAGMSIPPPDAARRLLADCALPVPDRIQVAGKGALDSVRAWCASYARSLAARVEERSSSPFDLRDIDSVLEALGRPTVLLPGGGSLVIERTEALTAIDVNAGSESNILSVNLAAAREIARQLRLRHIGGIVVIDFISLARAGDRSRIEGAFRAALASDPGRTRVLPMSALGLVELSRERRGPGLEFPA